MSASPTSNQARAVNFLQSGTGAVARPAQDKMRDIISAADYGIAPATAAATNSTKLAQLIANGARGIYFPAGFAQSTYNFGSAISLSVINGAVLFGDGENRTILKGPGGSANTLELTGNTTSINVKNLTLDGNGTTGTALLLQSTVPASGSDNGKHRFESIYLIGAATGSRVDTASEVSYDNVSFFGTSGAGKGLWVTSPQSVNILVKGGIIRDWDRGVQNIATDGTSEADVPLEGVTFHGNTTADIYTNYGSNWKIRGMFTEGSGRVIEVGTGVPSGKGSLFDIMGLRVNTITNADTYAIEVAAGSITLLLNGCIFYAANQKVHMPLAAGRIISRGCFYTDTLPFVGLHATIYVEHNGDIRGDGAIITDNYRRWSGITPTNKTADFVVDLSFQYTSGTHFICNGSATINVTMPSAANFDGREVCIKTIAAFTVVSVASDVVPLAGGGAGTAILAATAGKWARMKSDGTNWIIMEAN